MFPLNNQYFGPAPNIKSKVRQIRRGNVPVVKNDVWGDTPKAAWAGDQLVGWGNPALHAQLLTQRFTRMKDVTQAYADKTASLANDGRLNSEGVDNRNNKLKLLNTTLLREDEVATPDIPPAQMKSGGIVPKDGLYRLHKGEKVIPANRAKAKPKKK